MSRSAADPALLGTFAHLQQLCRDLLAGAPAGAAHARPLAGRASLAWQFARDAYRETRWLRERLCGDADLSTRVRHLFEPDGPPLARQCAALPSVERLLAWAAEIDDEHLRLATPGAFPAHALLADDRLVRWLVQERARDYERLLALRLAWVLSRPDPVHRVAQPLAPAAPGWPLVAVEQGHYRVGARDAAAVYDHERPAQAVQLAAFRIAAVLASNAQYLGFLRAVGEGQADGVADLPRLTPVHWRRDAAGDWFGLGLNGPADLPADTPVCGIDQRAARAFTAWAATHHDAEGAVLPHEYQWEVAARLGHLPGIGQVWEWCANPLHAYEGFEPFPAPDDSSAAFASGAITQRGASLHTQPCLRRASLRQWAAADDAHGHAGFRLVLPP